jgi:RNA polymerase primary sigma factor
VVAKNIDPVANATAFRRYEESRNDLVDSILQLRPYDRLLKELVAQAKEASPNLQTQRAFYLAHNALHNMATSQETMRKHNQRLVAKLAHPRSNRGNASYGLDFEELMAEGNIGLMKAIELFDHRRGVSFATHAHWWIRASIEYARRDRTCTIRLPSHIVGALSKLRNAENSLRAAFNREPTPEELAEKMDQPVAFVVRVQEAARLAYTSSLDAPLKEGEDGGSWHDQTEDTQVPDSIHLLFQGQSRTILTRAMLTLKPREERLLRMRFGVHPNNDHTLEEVGAKFSLTHERVRQLEAKALRKLKHKATPLKLRQLVA